MWVLAVGALGDPVKEVETGGAVGEGERVAIVHVDHECQVPVGGELIGNKLAILPDPNDVRNKQNAGALMGLVGGRSCEISVVLASDSNGLADGVTSGNPRSVASRGGDSVHEAKTYSCLTPTVQHCPGGFEAIA